MHHPAPTSRQRPAAPRPTRRSLLARAAAAGAAAAAPAVHGLAVGPAAAASATVTASTALAAGWDSADETTYLAVPATDDFTVTNGAVAIVLLAAHDRDQAALTISSISSNSPAPLGSLTQIAKNQYIDLNNDNTTMWAYWALGTGNGGTLTVTFDRQVDNLVWHVVELAGANTTAPVAQSEQGTGTGTPMDATLTTPSAANGHLIFGGLHPGEPTWTTPTGFSKLGEFFANDTSITDHGIATFFSGSAEASVSIAHTGGPDWGFICLELAAA